MLRHIHVLFSRRSIAAIHLNTKHMTDLQKRPGNWYVLYTRFQYTRRIASAILREQGHCFFPMQVVIRKWSDRVKKIETPLFLNYIFVHATPEERIRYLELEGALHYVSLMGKPVVVRDQAMDPDDPCKRRGGCTERTLSGSWRPRDRYQWNI